MITTRLELWRKYFRGDAWTTDCCSYFSGGGGGYFGGGGGKRFSVSFGPPVNVRVLDPVK